MQKHPVIVFSQEGVSSEKDKKCTSCSRCGSKFLNWTYLFLFLVLFLSNIFLHYKCMTLSNELSELQTRESLPSASSFVASPLDSAHSDVHHNNERSLTRRDSRQSRRRRGRRATLNHLEYSTERHRLAINKIINRPAIHMRGSSSDITTIQNEIFDNGERGNIFQWQHRDPNYPNPSFRYIHNAQDSTVIVAIIITNPGLYLVYSQVIIQGPEREYDPAYGLETIRRPPFQEPEVLLKSHVTQDGRGGTYPNIAGYNGRRPMDFINQMGMFELECEDTIYIRKPSQSSGGHYPRLPEQTYFGLELIKPKYNYLEHLNGC